MTEKLLHFIWKYQYFNRTSLFTTKGEPLSIIFAGTLNAHQGPDFNEAKIKIGQTTLAGSIEMHLLASDWLKHKHQDDPNYNNVVLHVVYKNDKILPNNIPVLELQPYISTLMLSTYDGFMKTSTLACALSVHTVKELTWLSWKERLLAERLTKKAGNFLKTLYQNNNHWEAAFWQMLCRNFGIKVNAEAFEAIGQSLSINLLAKHKNNIHQLEALLLGQANLLLPESEDAYSKMLFKEYTFLKKKYALQPILYPIHFLRMRPSNFPTVRLAQLAMLVHSSSHLFSKVLEESDVKKVKQWLDVTANDYWHYHYRLAETSAYKPKNTGAQIIDNIIINTIAPALFAYGLYHKNESYKEKAVAMLEATKAENNSVVNEFVQLQIANNTAFDSQALIELRTEYCNSKRCLECGIGNALLKRAV